jgi:hypothetical protein
MNLIVDFSLFAVRASMRGQQRDAQQDKEKELGKKE